MISLPDSKRKKPRQTRSKATVEAIYEAAAHILATDGFDKLTTAKVAYRAGASIGSLYQYFSDKRALCAAVYDHYGVAFLAAFTRRMDNLCTTNLPDTIDEMIDFVVNQHPHRPELHRTLMEVARHVGREEAWKTLSAEAAKTIEAVLSRHRAELAPDLEIPHAAKLIELVLETISHRMIEDHPIRLMKSEAFSQSRRLILSYLTSPDRYASEQRNASPNYGSRM